MPQTYDTGFALPLRTLIRRAVMQRLAVLRRSTGMYLQGVVALPARLNDDEDSLKVLDDAREGAAPVMAVALGRGDYRTHASGLGHTNTRKAVEIFVYVVSTHRRGNVEGRLENDAAAVDVTKDPGIDTMLEHAEQVLIGADLGISGVEEIRGGDENEIFSGDDMSIWELTLSVHVDRDINRDRVITQLLTEIDTSTTADGVATSEIRTPVEPS